jgi:hypothetical protein
MNTYNFYEDPGHGWLAVPMITLYELGIVDKISTYSYMRGLTAYLEEDCDYSVFAAAMRDAGREFSMRDKHTDNRSPIRSYDPYSAPRVRYALVSKGKANYTHKLGELELTA